MPIIDGKPVRARFDSLKLDELSSVDIPAQGGARALCIKRDDSADRAAAVEAIAKYYADDGEKARSFDEAVREQLVSDRIWPYTDALSRALRSIVMDEKLSDADRQAKAQESVDQFIRAVANLKGGVEIGKQVAKLNKREDKMTEEEMQAAIDAANAEAEDAKKRADKAEAELATKSEKLEVAEKALADATDETLKVGDTEVRKSEVGEAQFNLTKSLLEDRDMARFEKAATESYSHVPGDTAAKAKVLRAIEKMDEETAKAATAILDAAEKMVAQGFDRLGSGDNETRKAASAFMEKVAEVEKRDGCSRREAMQTARKEFPQEFEAYNGN